MRHVRLTDFLTDKEIKQAVRMWNESQADYAKRVHDAITLPQINRINTALGQENDPMYLAYMLEYVMNQSSTGGQYDS